LEIAKFIVFLLVSHLLLMQIFRFSTYHRFFWLALPFLVGYGALVAWLLFKFNMHAFFLWQLVLASVWLGYGVNKQLGSSDAMMEMVGNDPEALKLLASSSKKTVVYYILSSIIYIATFSIFYVWLYNT
jgi:hypothetical protein